MPGIVAGATRIQEGVLSHLGATGQRVFASQRSYFVYLVRFGMTNKPVPVLAKNMEKIGFIKRFPYRWTRATKTTWSFYSQDDLPGMK
jgi:hypothetical protein